DPWRRLDVALGVLAELNCPAVPAPTLAECRRLQVGGLRYGTWLGCRIRAAQSGYKLYVEVADGAEPPSGLVAPKREAQLRLGAGRSDPRPVRGRGTGAGLGRRPVPGGHRAAVRAPGRPDRPRDPRVHVAAGRAPGPQHGGTATMLTSLAALAALQHPDGCFP